jgi:DNA-binding response OmpR family regulator
MTGYGQEADRRMAREAGFDHHLVKPIHPDALLELLARAAEGGARHQVRRFLWLSGRVCDRGGAAAAEGGVSVLRALGTSACARMSR